MKYFIFFLAFGLILACKSVPLSLSDGELHSGVHERNVGLITFMNQVVPFEQYTEADFQKKVALNGRDELSARIFLGKTLTSYLHDLAPDLSVEELCKKGNFYISFLLNGQEVFSEAINKGAGSCWYRNSATAYRIPLANSEDDHWGRFMWTRFMYQNGGSDLLSEGSHTFEMQVRPYLELEKNELIKGEVIASGSVLIEVGSVDLDFDIKESQTRMSKILPYDTWEVSTETYDTSKFREVKKRIIGEEYKQISSIVVVKNDELLVEEYFNGANRKEKFNTRSVGKSFMSAVMGLAIDKGYIKSVDEPLSAFYELKKFDNYSDDKASVTIKQLLTMSSGFEGDDSAMDSPGNEEYMYPTKNWVKFALDLPLRGNNSWSYFTAGSVVLGDLIDKSVPGGLEAFADTYLLGPLGITEYQWQYTPQKVANTAGGIQMNALDFAKFGQLYKNQGKWKGKQIISKE